MPNKEEIIDFIKEIIYFENGYLETMPSGCHNSYGAGEAIGSRNTAKKILHFIETGENIDD